MACQLMAHGTIAGDSILAVDPAKWHALRCAGPVRGASSGSSRAQISSALKQRVLKTQPDGGLSGSGGSPFRMMRRLVGLRRAGFRNRRQQGLRIGMSGSVEHLAALTGFDDAAKIHHGDAVGDVAHHRKIVGDEQVGKAKVPLQSFRRLTTCAWMETSRAETASSRMSRSGRSANARAMAMRCRWPPENSLGRRWASVDRYRPGAAAR